MEKIDLILWILSGGFALMLVMWHSLNSKIDHVNDSLSARIDNVNSARIDNVNNSLGARIDKLDEKVTDIDRRLCRLEGAFASKDCCMIKDEKHMRKAE